MPYGPEGFDLSAALPAGWVAEAAGFAVAAAAPTVASDPNAMRLNAVGAPVSAYYGVNPGSANVRTRAFVRLKAGSIIGITCRGSASAFAAFSGYAFQVGVGSNTVLRKAAGGAFTDLLQLAPVIPVDVNLLATLSADGNAITASLQRLDTGEYLTNAGAWNAAPQNCFSANDATIPGVGKSGVYGYTGAPSGVLVDDFEVTELTPATTYTVNGPTQWVPGVAATYTVTSNGMLAGPVSVTITPTNGVMSNSGIVILGSGFQTSGTITYTPAAAGTGTLAFANDGGLANPAARSVRVAAPTSRPLGVPFDPGYSGLAGTVGLTLLEPTGDTHAPRTTAGITEPVPDTGFYRSLVVLPEGWSGFAVWDTGGSAPAYAFSVVDPPGTGSGGGASAVSW